jgi:hypothetical protein
MMSVASMVTLITVISVHIVHDLLNEGMLWWLWCPCVIHWVHDGLQDKEIRCAMMNFMTGMSLVFMSMKTWKTAIAVTSNISGMQTILIWRPRQLQGRFISVKFLRLFLSLDPGQRHYVNYAVAGHCKQRHSSSELYAYEPRARSFRWFSETPEVCLKWGYPGSIQPWVRAGVYLQVGTPR